MTMTEEQYINPMISVDLDGIPAKVRQIGMAELLAVIERTMRDRCYDKIRKLSAAFEGQGKIDFVSQEAEKIPDSLDLQSDGLDAMEKGDEMVALEIIIYVIQLYNPQILRQLIINAYGNMSPDRNREVSMAVLGDLYQAGQKLNSKKKPPRKKVTTKKKKKKASR